MARRLLPTSDANYILQMFDELPSDDSDEFDRYVTESSEDDIEVESPTHESSKFFFPFFYRRAKRNE